MALVLGLTAIQIGVLASLDETVYKVSAARYAADGLSGVVQDDVARGLARLYSIVIAPIVAVLPGDAAVRAARGLNALLWAATALPVYLLARRVVRSRALAVAAALLAIAVPWATISTVVFSEALAYLLFACTLLAMLGALRDPSPRRDLLVLVLLAALVTTRMQFVALGVGWLVAVLVEARRAAPSAGVREALGVAWRRHPFLVALTAAALFVVLVGIVAGFSHTLVRRIGGPYAEIQDRGALPADVGQAALFEAGMIALGVGLIPAVLAASWWRDALAGRLEPEARRLALLGTALLVLLFAGTLAAQSGWVGTEAVEERYYVYAVPLILVAAMAALERGVAARTIVVGGIVLAGLLAVLPVTAQLTAERAFLVPVAATSATALPRFEGWLADLLGLNSAITQRDLMVLAALAVTALAVLGLRRARWLVLAPAVVVQLFFLVYALAAMHGQVGGIKGVVGGADFAAMAWVDRAPGSGRAALLDDRLDPDRVAVLATVFWNDDILRVVRAPALMEPGLPYPVSAIPDDEVEVGPDLALTPQPTGAERLVVDRDSPLLQLEGRVLHTAPGGGELLIEPARPVRATWVASGLATDGGVTGPAAVLAAPARLELTFDSTPEAGGGKVQVRLGERSREVEVAAGAEQTVRIDACDGEDGGGPVSGTIEPVGTPAVRLRAVAREPC